MDLLGANLLAVYHASQILCHCWGNYVLQSHYGTRAWMGVFYSNFLWINRSVMGPGGYFASGALISLNFGPRRRWHEVIRHFLWCSSASNCFAWGCAMLTSGVRAIKEKLFRLLEKTATNAKTIYREQRPRRKWGAAPDLNCSLLSGDCPPHSFFFCIAHQLTAISIKIAPVWRLFNYACPGQLFLFCI